MISPLTEKKAQIAKIFFFLSSWLLGGVFIYSSFHKIVDPSGFARILYGYNLFPLLTIHPFAVMVPFFELLAGLALLIGVYRRGASLVVSGMLVVFIFAISVNLIRGHEFDCGCFSLSHDNGMSALQLLVRDIFFLVASIYVMFYDNFKKLS